RSEAGVRTTAEKDQRLLFDSRLKLVSSRERAKRCGRRQQSMDTSTRSTAARRSMPRCYPRSVSLYGIHKTLYLLQNDLDFRELLRTDPETALANVPLTDQERTALLHGDVAD